jgi:tetratricopeptide (TPR) repeat protein
MLVFHPTALLFLFDRIASMADSSHGLDAEIQKFEQKHGENPEGRYFVPLANAYRKSGLVEQAEDLLREGLKRHPDYLSAHIVLGRCLADRGATAEAEDEFRRVISGDPHNLVALRSLGDLAASTGRRAEAVSWYEQLLAIDPMSSEAREALQAVQETTEQQVAPPEEDAAGSFASAGGQPDPAPERTFEPLELDGGFDAPDLDRGFELPPRLGEEPPAEQGRGAEPPKLGEMAFGAGFGLGPDEPEDSAPGDDQVTEIGELAMEGGADAPAGGAHAEEGDEVEVVTETIAELYAAQGFSERALAVYRELVRRRGEEPALLRRISELEARSPGGSAGTVQAADPDPFADSFAEGFGGGEDREEGESSPRVTVASFFGTLLAWKAGSRHSEQEVDAEPEYDFGALVEEPEPEAEADYDFAVASEPEAPPAPGGAEEPDAPASGSSSEEPALPWESGSPAPDEAANPWESQAPVADEAPAGGGDFSFDEYFGEGAEAQPAPPAADEPRLPEPQGAADPAPPSPPAEDAGADAGGGPGEAAAPADEVDPEDLESFQTWLRSLKR